MEEQTSWFGAQEAMITAIIAIIGTIISILQAYFERKQWNATFKSEKERWEIEFNSQQKSWEIENANQREKWVKEFSAKYESWRRESEVDLRTKFLYELVMARFKTYPAILELLGTVRDIPDPNNNHYQDLEANPNILIDVAENLVKHLYSEAGLVMSMDTRNYLLQKVYQGCYLFKEGKKEIEDLVEYFFIGRRKLRSDLQIIDWGEDTTLDELVNKVKEKFE